MLKIKLAIIVFILLNCLSCSRNNSAQDNPDAQLCSIKGDLLYIPPFDRWEIHCPVSTDTIEIYVVRNYKIDLRRVIGDSKKVQATGFCTQSDEIPYALHDSLPPIPEFVFYYIDIKDLKYE